VLSVGAGPEAQSIMKRMEREATHRYQTLTLPEDKAANCLFVNGSLIHRGKLEAPKSHPVS
jgi:dimethylargininase